METQTTRPVADLVRLTKRTDAEDIAVAVYARLIDFLGRLEPDAWTHPTECDGWNVADMVGHLIGAGRSCASVRELARQQWWAKRHAAQFDGNSLDAANGLQVREHAGLTPSERIAALRRIAPAAVHGRMRLPRPLRQLGLPLDQTGSTATGMPTRLTLGHLMDVVYTRDVWLHTIDIARATSRAYLPDPKVDGRIIEDIVAEWAARHGEPFVLTLTGPAGGRFRAGVGGGHLQLDAVEFGRVLSGRAEPPAGCGEPATATELLQFKLVF